MLLRKFCALCFLYSYLGCADDEKTYLPDDCIEINTTSSYEVAVEGVWERCPFLFDEDLCIFKDGKWGTPTKYKIYWYGTYYVEDNQIALSADSSGTVFGAEEHVYRIGIVDKHTIKFNETLLIKYKCTW